ncbi:MAG: DUF5719 family protein [Actinomycetota bacterium]|nr:DUF5719 family protein [Actinomycetota bacterium]
MGSGIRKSFGIHICCSILVLSFLVAIPVVSSTTGGGGATAAPAGSEINADPLGRLPATPEEAHQRMESREISWQGHADDGDSFDVASVQSGVLAAIPFDTVEGYTTSANTGVTVELWRGAVKIQTVNTTTNADKWFSADLSTGDIQSGDIVRIQDAGGGAAVDIDTTLTGNMNTGTNVVSGTAKAGNFIDVWISAPGTYYGDIPPGVAYLTTRATGGNWSVNFTNTLNLLRGDAAFVFSIDGNSNVVLDVCNAGGSLVVYPQYDDVMGYDQPAKSLTIDVDGTSQTVGTAGDGFFEAWFTDYNIVPGDIVSCAQIGGGRAITVADISATCDPDTNKVEGTGPPNRTIRLIMAPYVDPVVYETTTNASGAFTVDLGDRYTAIGSEVFNITWYDSDADCVVYEFQTFSWYLPEGYTGGQFDTWVLVQNPGDEDVPIKMTFQVQDGSAPARGFDIPAQERRSFHLDEFEGLADAQVSTKVTSTSGATIIAERAEYFDYDGKQGGHDSIGTIMPSTTWYLAEGYTGGDFDTWVLIQNPGTEPADITLDFQVQGGSAPSRGFTVPAGERKSFHLDEFEGLSDAQVSTKVTSDEDVVAERAEYFDYDGKKGGHDSIGVTCPGKTWYLAEGYTGGQFDTWVLVQNPGTQPADITLDFQVQGGSAPSRGFTVPAGERTSFHLDEFEGLSDAQVSTKVTSNMDVVAERAMYFIYDGKQGGHDSRAADAPADTWYLAEGYTGGQFDTWVLVQNPGTQDCTVTLEFQVQDGSAPDYSFTLAAGERFSVHLDELDGLSDAQVSTKVTAQRGYETADVVAERAEYFIYDGKQGGHDSVGVPQIFME